MIYKYEIIIIIIIIVIIKIIIIIKIISRPFECRIEVVEVGK